jgi:hypothetical protein
MRGRFALPILSLLAACGSTSAPSEPLDASAADTATSEADASVTPDGAAPVEPTWQLLVDGEWTLPPGSEDYQCILLTIEEDTFVHAIRPVGPLGTHHTVLSLVPASQNVGADRQFACDGFMQGPHMLFGSGVGTEGLEFPDGIAVPLRRGQRVLLNLHLFNFDNENPLSGRSAIEIQTMSADDVVAEAEVVLAGKDEGLTVAARRTSTQTGRCTFGREQTIFAVMPHMHLTGAAMRVTAVRSGMPDLDVFDETFDFDQQSYELIDPQVVMPRSSRLSIECTYDNPGEARRFGESSNDEMCYAAVYRYPASGAAITCTD